MILGFADWLKAAVPPPSGTGAHLQARPGKQHECGSAAGSEQSRLGGGRVGTESQGCLLSHWPWAQGSHLPGRRKNGGDRSRAFTTPLGWCSTVPCTRTDSFALCP